MSKPYRPSSGTEGDMFIADFCDHCAHYKGCTLIVYSMAYQKTDPRYPAEWISDDNGENPRCTAFEHRGNGS